MFIPFLFFSYHKNNQTPKHTWVLLASGQSDEDFLESWGGKFPYRVSILWEECLTVFHSKFNEILMEFGKEWILNIVVESLNEWKVILGGNLEFLTAQSDEWFDIVHVGGFHDSY